MLQLKQAPVTGPGASFDGFRLATRTSLAVNGDRMEALAHRAARSWSDAVSEVLDQPATADRPPTRGDDGETDDWTTPIWWWVDQMAGPDSGLTDRMAWFWHTLLTTNAEKVSTVGLVADQLHLLRTLGRTDLPTLVQAFVKSGALQEYLDGSYSVASNPNENLARELMELFTVGKGVGRPDPAIYTEDDVKAAARALAGWVVEDGKVEFRRQNAFVAPLLFLGEQAKWDTDMIIDRLCHHPAASARIAGRLWLHLVGTPLSPDDKNTLGEWWTASDLAIDPLIERILNSPAFRQPESVRARSGLEWFCAARSAIGASSETNWSLWSTGQVPYRPPNVAGWQDYGGNNIDGRRWLSAGSLLGRTSVVWSLMDDAGLFSDQARFPTETDEVLTACGIATPAETTRQTLESVGDGDLSQTAVGQVRWRLALSSVEFNLI